MASKKAQIRTSYWTDSSLKSSIYAPLPRTNWRLQRSLYRSEKKTCREKALWIVINRLTTHLALCKIRWTYKTLLKATKKMVHQGTAPKSNLLKHSRDRTHIVMVQTNRNGLKVARAKRLERVLHGRWPHLSLLHSLQDPTLKRNLTTVSRNSRSRPRLVSAPRIQTRSIRTPI